MLQFLLVCYYVVTYDQQFFDSKSVRLYVKGGPSTFHQRLYLSLIYWKEREIIIFKCNKFVLMVLVQCAKWFWIGLI